MRLKQKFVDLKKENRSGLITYIMAHDPDLKTSQEILNRLAESGSDIIELGMPFSDPMADGPVIQQAAVRALKNKPKIDEIFDLVINFRQKDKITPIILMGYYNPIQKYGVDKFVSKAKSSGVDGFIIVDLPPEEDILMLELCDRSEIALIKLLAPTSNEKRIEIVAKKARGFVYYVSITGITGTKSANAEEVEQAINKIRKEVKIPIVVGFGIKNSQDVRLMKGCGDAVVVGSSIVDKIANIDKDGIEKVFQFVRELRKAL